MSRTGALLAGALCLLVLGSCGGSNDTTTGPSRAESPEQSAGAGIERANANCRELLRDVKRIGRRVRGRGGFGTSLAMTTEGLAEPATRVVKRIAKRQRSLRPVIDDPRFDLYVRLFDPVVVLAEERVQAGRREDAARSEKLQYLLTDLGDEQRLAARRAGLKDCEVDFFGAMVRASGG